ncbi:type II secretion system F family protein, partial [Candidatus Woesearchaeota archaeon]|nr:type II secretion system F family protein [Candidatus Woesearchaeota archaeon]
FSLFFAKVSEFYFGIILAVVVSALIFFMQLNYPKIASSRRIRKLDSDLLASLQAIMIQLNSGISLFESLVILSNQEFGEISIEFKKVVKKINAGVPQIKALEDAALQNPSPYFRRALWQIINGMKEGATINKVIATTISNLNKEQIIQIEKYGGQLNPLAMFYMMGAVIVPTLSITFFVVLASFIGLSDVIIKASFLGLLCFVIFFQFMFSGIIKTKRPSLLGE